LAAHNLDRESKIKRPGISSAVYKLPDSAVSVLWPLVLSHDDLKEIIPDRSYTFRDEANIKAPDQRMYRAYSGSSTTEIDIRPFVRSV
jgi:hypothetical protein